MVRIISLTVAKDNCELVLAALQIEEELISLLPLFD